MSTSHLTFSDAVWKVHDLYKIWKNQTLAEVECMFKDITPNDAHPLLEVYDFK